MGAVEFVLLIELINTRKTNCAVETIQSSVSFVNNNTKKKKYPDDVDVDGEIKVFR